MNPRRLLPAAIGVAVLSGVLSACSLTPQPVETRLPPGAEASTPTAAAPSPSVVTVSPAPVASATVPAPSSTSDGAAVSCGDGGNHAVSGAEQSVRVVGTCGELTVSGSAVTVDASGATIGTLRISGDRARVEAAAIDTLVLQGNDGTVRSAAAIGSVDVSGDRAAIDASGAISTVTVRGQDNVVRAAGGVGATTVEGRGNQIG